MPWDNVASALGTSVTGALDSVQPVIIIVLGAIVGYALFKRFVAGR